MANPNDKENLVKLTAKEHFICHLLLTKMMVDTINHHKMVYAMWRINNSTKNGYIATSKIYENIRNNIINSMSGENSPNLGRNPYCNKTEEELIEISRKKVKLLLVKNVSGMKNLDLKPTK